MDGYLNIDTEGRVQLEARDFEGKRTIVLGTTGAGKSNLDSVLLEELSACYPFAIIDPHGEYFTLRERYPYLVIGQSDNCDVLIEPSEAAAFGEYCYLNRRPVILDLYNVTDEELRMEYVVAFCSALWAAVRKVKVGAHQPYGLLVDEAHNFIPERRSKEPGLALMKAMAMEGRKFELIVIASTQRTAEISKSFLAMCELRFFLRVTDDADVEPIMKRLSSEAHSRGSLRSILTGLPTGKAFFRSSSRQSIVQIRERHTQTAAQANRLRAGGGYELTPFDTVEIAAILSAVGKVSDDGEEAARQADDARLVPALRDQIARLTREKLEAEQALRNLPAQTEPEVVRAFTEDDLALLAGMREEMILHFSMAHAAAQTLVNMFERIFEAFPDAFPDPDYLTLVDGDMEDTGAIKQVATEPVLSRNVPPKNGMIAILLALYRSPNKTHGLTRGEIALLAGYALGGYFNKSFKAAAEARYIVERINGASAVYVISGEGLTFLNQEVSDATQEPFTAQQLVRLWDGKLSETGKRFLKQLMIIRPQTMTRAQLAARTLKDDGTPYALGGYVNTQISQLLRTGLIVDAGNSLKASDTLYLAGKAAMMGMPVYNMNVLGEALGEYADAVVDALGSPFLPLKSAVATWGFFFGYGMSKVYFIDATMLTAVQLDALVGIAARRSPAPPSEIREIFLRHGIAIPARCMKVRHGMTYPFNN